MCIEKIKTKILPILKEAGVKKSSIFGSYVRGDQTESSDIDILVELPKGSSLLDLIGLEIELKKAVGKKVDLLTYNSINPLLKDYIQKDQLRIL
ncbi:nucleotidyltransferase family protein [Candidatus Daviesbacteria bacterium]|nr:nucleotidyltransferase family protein [Candidatus Daviesbacteria bacterium]